MLGWPKRCKLAHAFLWEYRCKRLKLAQLLGQLGVFLTLVDATIHRQHPSLEGVGAQRHMHQQHHRRRRRRNGGLEELTLRLCDLAGRVVDCDEEQA